MRAALASVLLAACAAEPQLPPEGPHYQYVVSELHIPASNVEARQYGLDLNGDKIVDNQLGMVFATLDSMGLGVDDTAREALVRGGLIMLADLQTPDFDNTEATGLTTFLGRDPSPAACLDPMDINTCGQHLTGTGRFVIKDATESGLAVGPIVDGVFRGGMDRLPVEIALINPTQPIAVELHGARVRAIEISPTGATAIIGGGITKYDVDNAVIPEAAAQIDRIIVDECGQPTSDPCGCLANSRASLLRGVFDANRDCRVDLEEVATNSLVVSLVSPDITVGGEKLLSFGVGVELVSATFPWAVGI